MPNDEILYEESERMPRWIAGLVSLLFVAALVACVAQLRAAKAEDARTLMMVMAFVFIEGAVIVGLLVKSHMLIRIEPALLHLRIKPVGRHRDFPLAELTGEMEIRDHHPWDRFHHRTIKGGRYAFTAKRLVQIHLVNGGWLLIGSQQPEALVAALRKARGT